MNELHDNRVINEPPCKKRILECSSSSCDDDLEIASDANNKISEDPEEEEDLPPNLDAYSQHFNYILSEQAGSEKLTYRSEKLEWPEIGKFVFMKPVLRTVSCKEPSVKKSVITDFHLKKNLLNSISASSQIKKMSKTQIGFLNLISDYFDVAYMKTTHENGEKLRFIYTLHILNHILKSKAKIIHHNSKLSKNPEEEYRDQGFTQTVSVILVPFRHDCHRIVSHLLSMLPECAVMNKKRFETEYGPPPPVPDHIKKKPQDYYKIFEGNKCEDFKIGLKIKNKSITLYSEFYSSDLIIASPLGLRQVIGANDKDRDSDFLSSVEVLVIDRAEVLMLQNIVHFLYVLKHFNMLPKESRGCNFFRVRMYALNGLSKFFRQTILLSSVEYMWFEALIFQNHCSNYSGYLISMTDVKSPAIQHILIPMKMCFRWFDVSSPENAVDERFKFFIDKVLPDYKDKSMGQTMIYIPSYSDFCTLRNYFRIDSGFSCAMICEYTKTGKVAQERNVFFKRDRHFMLYTERAHFYFRYHIKGIQHILFYQPPTYPGFFRELCNLMMDSNPSRKYEEKSCCVLASKYDSLQVKHMVGITETRRMCNSKKKIFVKYIN